MRCQGERGCALNSNSLRAKARRHEVRRVPLSAIHAATVDAVAVPGRRLVLSRVGRRAVIGWLRLLLRLAGRRLRQGWEAEHGATRVAFGCPRTRSVVLGGGGSRGRCRKRRMVVRRPPGIVVRVVWSMVIRWLRRLGRVLVRWRVKALLHRERRERLIHGSSVYL